MAKSLFQLVLDFVGDHQKIFKLESVTGKMYSANAKKIDFHKQFIYDAPTIYENCIVNVKWICFARASPVSIP